MKTKTETIEERARTFADNYDLGGFTVVAGLVHDAVEKAYMAGASDQRRIDADSACGWLLGHENQIYWAVESPSCSPSLMSVVEDLRKEMEGLK